MTDHLTLAIENEPKRPATVAEIAAINFLGDRELPRLSEKERIEITRENMAYLHQMAVLSLGTVTLDKQDLVEKVRKHHDLFGPMLLSMADVIKLASSLVGLFESTEARLAVAIATVENEPDDDPDGGEDIPEDGAEEAVAA